VRLDFQELGGKLVKDGEKRLRFEADWPADLASRPIDLHTVAFAPPEAGKGGLTGPAVRQIKPEARGAEREVCGAEREACEPEREARSA
jgi:hypothetical protein